MLFVAIFKPFFFPSFPSFLLLFLFLPFLPPSSFLFSPSLPLPFSFSPPDSSIIGTNTSVRHFSPKVVLDYSLHLELPVNDLQFLDMSSDNTFWAMERKTKYVRQPGSQWIQYPNYGRHVIDFNGETVKYIQRNAYREFKLKSVEVSREEVIQEIRTLDVHTDLYGEVWIAGIHGAFAFDTNEIFAEKLPFFEEETRVNCLYSDSLYLYGATFGKGVFQYHLQDATVRWITTEDGLASNTCSALTIDPYGKLWVGTNQGVSVMQPDSVGWSLVKNLHQFDGLEAQKINCLKAYQGLMWFGTDIGLWSTPLNDLSVNDFAPQVLITGKEILSREGGKSWQARELTYRENNLRFSFAAPLYRNGGEIKYRCVLYPNDSIYRYSNSSYPSVQYNSLAPGEYALAVQAQNSDGRWGPETAYSFVINPPYWGTWWINNEAVSRSEEHTSELQSPDHLVCRLLLEKKKKTTQ